MVYISEVVRNFFNGTSAKVYDLMPSAGKTELWTRVALVAVAAGILGGCVGGRKTSAITMVAGGVGAFAYFTNTYTGINLLSDFFRS